MAYTGEYWETRDLGIVVQDDVSHQFTVRNAVTGAAIDISGWQIYFKATASRGHSTDTISVGPGAITKSSSGSGTTDRFTLHLSSSDTDIDYGRYTYDLAADTTTEEKVLMRGILTAYDRDTVVA